MSGHLDLGVRLVLAFAELIGMAIFGGLLKFSEDSTSSISWFSGVGQPAP